MRAELLAADLIARSVRAAIEALAMQTENECRADRGLAQAYGEEAFYNLIGENGLDRESMTRALAAPPETGDAK